MTSQEVSEAHLSTSKAPEFFLRRCRPAAVVGCGRLLRIANHACRWDGRIRHPHTVRKWVVLAFPALVALCAKQDSIWT